jgi:LysM repeat protein
LRLRMLIKLLRMRRFLLISLFLVQMPLTFAGFQANNYPVKYTRNDYIEMWRLVALQKMYDHGIPASITLAQGILESGNGNSTLAREANNHFGIKCHGWDGPGYYMDDDAKDECFRVYKTADESFEDHSQFLMKRRYEDLFNLKVTDYKGWAKGLKKAGYATNPKYANKLIDIIEESELDELDKLSYKEFLAMGGSKKKSSVKKANVKKAKEDEVEELVILHGREIDLSANNVKYTLAKDGDNYEKIAADLNLGRWEILKYNDLEKNSKIKPGDIIYIQPKRSKANVSVHVIKPGESFHDISQFYGIKLKKLLKRNHIESGTKPVPGEKIKLN